MAKVIAICNQKGGVGKTTTAINLAACIATTGPRCLIVDLDPQSNATSGVLPSRPRECSTSHLLLATARAEEILTPTTIDSLAILCASPALIDVEERLLRDKAGVFALKMALAPLNERFDYILIDCPPSLGIFSQNAMNAAASVLIPIQCEYFAMEGLAEALHAIRRTRSSTNPHLSLQGILLTMYDPAITLAREIASEIRAYFAGSVFKTIIPRDVKLAEATSFGVPLISHDITACGAIGYVELAREFLSTSSPRPFPLF